MCGAIGGSGGGGGGLLRSYTDNIRQLYPRAARVRVSRDDACDRVGRRTLACTVARLRTEGRSGRC